MVMMDFKTKLIVGPGSDFAGLDGPQSAIGQAQEHVGTAERVE